MAFDICGVCDLSVYKIKVPGGVWAWSNFRLFLGFDEGCESLWGLKILLLPEVENINIRG